MFIKVSFFSLVISFLVFISISTDAKVYQWIDDNGKIHFSDRKPVQQLAKEVNVAALQTVQFTPLNLKKPSFKKTRARKSKRPKRQTKCTSLKSEIQALQKKLSKRQKAVVFDKLNQQLVSLRWKKIKHC